MLALYLRKACHHRMVDRLNAWNLQECTFKGMWSIHGDQTLNPTNIGNYKMVILTQAEVSGQSKLLGFQAVLQTLTCHLSRWTPCFSPSVRELFRKHRCSENIFPAQRRNRSS